MRLILPVVLIAIPLLELSLLIKLGQIIGVWPTIAWIIITGVAGGAVIRRQGMTAMSRMINEMQEGRPPIAPVIDGATIMFAGILLLTPGLIADTLGFLMLIPVVRQALRRYALSRFTIISTEVTRETRTRTWPGRSGRAGRLDTNSRPTVIEGEYERLDDDRDKLP